MFIEWLIVALVATFGMGFSIGRLVSPAPTDKTIYIVLDKDGKEISRAESIILRRE